MRFLTIFYLIILKQKEICTFTAMLKMIIDFMGVSNSYHLYAIQNILLACDGLLAPSET